MTNHVTKIDVGFKAFGDDPLQFLQAAYDADNTVDMAAGILAHPVSKLLQKQTLKRLYQIGFLNGLPAPSEIRKMRSLAKAIIDIAEAAR